MNPTEQQPNQPPGREQEQRRALREASSLGANNFIRRAILSADGFSGSCRPLEGVHAWIQPRRHGRTLGGCPCDCGRFTWEAAFRALHLDGVSDDAEIRLEPPAPRPVTVGGGLEAIGWGSHREWIRNFNEVRAMAARARGPEPDGQWVNVGSVSFVPPDPALPPNTFVGSDGIRRCRIGGAHVWRDWSTKGARCACGQLELGGDYTHTPEAQTGDDVAAIEREMRREQRRARRERLLARLREVVAENAALKATIWREERATREAMDALAPWQRAVSNANQQHADLLELSRAVCELRWTGSREAWHAAIDRLAEAVGVEPQ